MTRLGSRGHVPGARNMTSREQIFAIFRNLKWIIAVSIVISVALYLPDQVRELYRIAADDPGWTTVKQFVAIVAIAVFIWAGSHQIATETAQRLKPLGLWPDRVLRLIPVVAGALPLAAAAAGQIASRPGTDGMSAQELATLREVGSVFRIQENALEFDKTLLWIYCAGFVAIAILFVVMAWRAAKNDRPTAITINASYFFRYEFLLATVALIALLTAVFVLLPDKPAQWLETFGVVALFTLCVVSFCVHISLLTIKHRIPIFPLIFGAGVVIAWLNLNDNHHVRTLPRGAAKTEPPRTTLAMAFPDWLKARQPAPASTEAFPIFVVSAQGGGIYAAHNAATFLARMQDLCPAFRRHLFAVSSVSGGSVGAAVFAAALHAADTEAASGPATLAAAAQQQCETIDQFLSGSARVTLGEAGNIETKVQRTLTTDFLSPLVAASMFADFTQIFLPVPVPAFDRARALEYTLENAADQMFAVPDAKASASNLLRMNYQEHWKPDHDLPALILNATDAGSGKRVVISPFDFDPRHPKDTDLCMLAELERTGAGPDEQVKSSALRMPLSTAAFVSARFPWITPAATVALKNDCMTRNPKVRLVDGGYIDNSGVETALNLIDRIEALRKTQTLPNFKIYLISLTGGDFPDHGAFSFNEAMEPIRALLSGRTSRAYTALNRASLRATVTGNPSPASKEAKTFRSYSRTDLKNHFYNLPLGWALSETTRDIVFLNSGRFWDCEPDDNFSQIRKHLSNADCLQIQVYHLLNKSTTAAFAHQDLANRVSLLLGPNKAGTQKVDHQRLLACYERAWFHERGPRIYAQARERWANSPQEQTRRPIYPPYRKRYLAYYQSEHVRALLSEWDQSPENNERVLAYLLGSIAHDSWDFARTTENLSFRTVRQIPRAWRDRIEAINAKRKEKGVAPISLESLLNNAEALANIVWGIEAEQFGSKQPGDGWRFRPRGIYQIVGREQYQRVKGHLKKMYPTLGLDTTEFPDAVWNRLISAKIAIAHFHSHRYETQSGKRTLVELLKDNTQTWKSVRAVQKDMGASQWNQDMVAERSDMFLACVKEAATPRSRTHKAMRRLGLAE
jgi:predicted chitinase